MALSARALQRLSSSSASSSSSSWAPLSSFKGSPLPSSFLKHPSSSSPSHCPCGSRHLGTGVPSACRQLSVSATAAKPAVASPTDANPDHDWESFGGFGLKSTEFMYLQKCEAGKDWQPGSIVPYGPLLLDPSAGVLNYGQGVFEGMKAYRSEDGRLLIFRPQENALRMQQSADRMSMPAPSVDDFVKAVKDTVLANAKWVPPSGKGSLYIRPLLIGSGPVLGLAAAPEYSFVVYVSPVGNYFTGSIDLKVEEHYHRAAPGGTGAAKAIGNYSPVLKTQLAAKKAGFADVVYLDAVSNKYIEEVSSCNIFVVKNGVVATPDLRGTILPGITRKSVIQLAQNLGHTVEERQVSVDELMEADEVFCTGTAVMVSPVGSITYRGSRKEFASNLSQTLYQQLIGLQRGLLPDDLGWTVQVN